MERAEVEKGERREEGRELGMCLYFAGLLPRELLQYFHPSIEKRMKEEREEGRGETDLLLEICRGDTHVRCRVENKQGGRVSG